MQLISNVKNTALGGLSPAITMHHHPSFPSLAVQDGWWLGAMHSTGYAVDFEHGTSVHLIRYLDTLT
jgi:hypothetical protein